MTNLSAKPEAYALSQALEAVGQAIDADDWTTAETGAPILADALAWLDCRIHSRAAAGTHTIYVGEVQAASAPRPDEPPLVYWNRGYRALKLDEPS